MTDADPDATLDEATLRVAADRLSGPRVWEKLYVRATEALFVSIETDANGRLYLTAELREKYGERFHVAEYTDRIELVPIDDDPLRAVREEVGDALDDVSRDQLRAEARDRATRAATEEHERVTAPESDG